MAEIAVMGHGVVGSGVLEVLLSHSESIQKRAKEEIHVKYILDLREFSGLPYSDRFTKDFNVILNDPEVKIVVEVMGGLEPAFSYTKACLENGKSVVTSNKELVAQKGAELLALAQRNNLNFLFEASVGGGIPIIRPISQCLAANEMTEIAGILNGTTNFILTKMIREGMAFEDALKLAQQLGYAERDPSADVEVHDACRKICILSAIAFGRHIYPEQVPTQGITKVTLADVDYADGAGKKIKLLGRAIKMPDGAVCAYVAPHLIDVSHPLAGVDDVFNGISVRGDAIGDVMFYGRGAGKLPTASAVVADVMDIARNMGHRKALCWAPGGPEAACGTEHLASRWYVRANASPEALRAALGEVKLLARPGAPGEEAACLTDAELTQGQLEEKLNGLDVLSQIRVLN